MTIMAKDKKYIITRSNYTLKKKHKQLNNGNAIYERDFMITNNGQTWSGDGSVYGVNSFKMVNNPKEGGSYKYNSGRWLKTPKCNDEFNDYGDIWTLRCIPNKDVENSENNIHINPNTTSLLSFAYYSSTKDLVERSVKNIIENFPGEIIFTNDKSEEKEGYYMVENPFLIDLHTITNNKNEEDNLRLFIQNYDKYHILKYSNIFETEFSIEIESCEVEERTEIKCANEGDLLFITTINTKNDNIGPIVIECYYEDGEKVYYTNGYYGLRIRPNDIYVDNFFNNLDAFQKNMLNRWSTPKYTMRLETPIETEWGVEISKKEYKWPLKLSNIYSGKVQYDLWNIDIESSNYVKYLNDLLKICNFYDERCTNNLWRSLTHDSIKNMDYAFKDEKIEDNEYSLGEGRFEEIIKCYAKQFDDIKQSIDNIKTNNTITYSNNSNIPSYFLSDKLENSGWEVYNLANVLNENVKVDNYSVSDVNINMMKHLQINSKQILAHKGTRHGIDMLLGLFGYKSYDVDKENYDYKITEYVDVVKDNSNIDYDTVVSYNMKKKSFNYSFSDTEGDTTDPLQGLPIRAVKYLNNTGEENFYLIPWYDKNDVLDGDIYYQMYGGWGKSFINEFGDTININDTIAPSENIPIYYETIKSLIAVQNINDLKYISYSKKYPNCIAYVYNIDDFNNIYINDDITNITLDGEGRDEKATNYFTLHNTSNSQIIGSNKNGNITNYGWVNVTEKDITTNTDIGIRVKLLETIIETHKGNNPHGGFTKYDDGETYIDYFRKIFKYSIENGNFNDLMYTCEDGLLNDDVENIGFDIAKEKDNVKIWYFTNTNNTNENNKLLELTVEEVTGTSQEVIYKGIKYNNIKNINYTYNTTPQQNIKVGAEADDYTFFSSSVVPYNFEGGESCDESAANSIINNKKLLIEFSRGLMDNNTFPRFMRECILPYLIQMIPSTTIWEVRLDGDNAIYTERKTEFESVD